MEEHRLTEMQTALLAMLNWFDGFCREHGLNYYAVGGTLLGAVRHEGFIPWDDDIDVAMPRKDYEKLYELMNGQVFDHYVLETELSPEKDFCYPYAKLYDINTTLIEHCRKPLIRGLFLDIFPLDGVGKDVAQGKKWFARITKEYHFYLTRIAAIRKGRSLLKNLAVLVSRLIPSFIVDDVKLRQKLNKKCARFTLEESTYGGNLLGNWGEKELVPVKVIGEPKDYRFENMKIMGIEYYDEYLTHIYGDWRKLPPKEKQISHHDFVKLDLHNGYVKEM